ncbi:MAG: ATP-binding protein [Leptospirillia bacterium]
MGFVQSNLSTRDGARLRRLSTGLLGDLAGDVVMFNDPMGRGLAAVWAESYGDLAERYPVLPLFSVPPPPTQLLEYEGALFQGVTLPVEPGGHLLGYLTLAARMDSTFLGDVIRGTDADLVLLLDGRPVVGSSPEIKAMLPQMASLGHTTGGTMSVGDEVWRVEVSAPQGMLSGRVQAAVLVSEVTMRSEVSRLRWWVFLGGVSAFVGIGALGSLLVVRLTEPMARLTDAAEQVARGNLNTTVPEDAGGEIGALSRAFNVMVSTIKGRDSQLSRQMQDLEALREGAFAAIFITDPRYRIISGNGKAAEWTGIPLTNLPGTDLFSLLKPDQDGREWPLDDPDLLRDGATFEWGMIAGDGHIMPVEISGGQVAGIDPPVLQFFLRDLTEQKALQEQLLRSQKLEAIGTLAGGIAHDFNNLLAGIGGHSELVRMELPEDHPAQSSMETIEEAVARGAGLCRQLLGAARKEQQDFSVVDANQVVDEVVSLCRHTFPPAIRWDVRLDPQELRIQSDPGQFHQVLMNLLVNARDAIGAAEGRITVTSGESVVRPGDPLSQTDRLEPSRYVTISVSDTGCGIPKADQRRIFDPFYTTKEVGKGTGLGLSTVFDIVRNHGGTVTVHSKEGEGTRFSCYFPASRLASEENLAGAIARKKNPGEGGVSARIMVVDDEAAIRDILQILLLSNGYDVVVAENGLRAIQLLDQDSDMMPDLAIVDMLMPGMDGRDTVREMRQRFPGLPVVFATGYVDEDVDLSGFGSPNPVILAKPFRLERLSAIVDEQLSRKNRQ